MKYKVIIILLLSIICINVKALSINDINLNELKIDSNYMQIENLNKDNINEDIKDIVLKDLKKKKHNLKHEGIKEIQMYEYNNGYFVYINLQNALYKKEKMNVNIIYILDKNKKIIKREIEPFSKIKEKILNIKQSDIDDNIMKNIAILKTYNDTSVDKMAYGAFISNDVILTSAKFIKNSFYKNQEIIITKGDDIINISGIYTLNNEICLLKVDCNNNSYFNLGQLNKKEYTQINTNNNYQLSKTKINILNDENIKIAKNTLNDYSYASLIIDNNMLVGITLNNINHSYYEDIIPVNNLSNLTYGEYKSLDDVKKSYFINTSDVSQNLRNKNIDKYYQLGDLKNIFASDIKRANIKDNIATFRIENKTNNFNSNLIKYSNNLYDTGYELLEASSIKRIYQKGNSKIMILTILNSTFIVINGGI